MLIRPVAIELEADRPRSRITTSDLHPEDSEESERTRAFQLYLMASTYPRSRQVTLYCNTVRGTYITPSKT